ncbi:MAG TPA: hypothetical protein VHJ34_11130 [Actinomycetota bacterium]|nr:hypothetical protein [Actinomycetota bacterium]
MIIVAVVAGAGGRLAVGWATRRLRASPVIAFGSIAGLLLLYSAVIALTLGAYSGGWENTAFLTGFMAGLVLAEGAWRKWRHR